MKDNHRFRSIIGYIIIIIILPIITFFIAAYVPGRIAFQSIEWQPFESPPGKAVHFVESSSSDIYVEVENGSVYRHSYWDREDEWERVPSRRFAPNIPDTMCLPVIVPRKTVDRFQDCGAVYSVYYVILDDGSIQHYSIVDEKKDPLFVLAQTIKQGIIAIGGFLMGIVILILMWTFPIIRQWRVLQISLWIAVSIAGGVANGFISLALISGGSIADMIVIGISMVVGTTVTGIASIGLVWLWHRWRQGALRPG